MSTTPLSDNRGPLATAERALGPDLARGLMLLFIALANSHYFLSGDSVRGGFPMDGSTLDSAVTWCIATFVDGRAFPMFGLLFGYGVAMIVRRQAALGAKGVRHLLWRRAVFLIVVGFLHAMLLYVGDILAAYGVLLLLGAWAVRWKDGWLLGVAAVIFALGLLPSGDSMSIVTDPPDPSMLPPDLLTMFADRIVVQPFIMLLGPIGFACPFLVGLWAGRRRVLERPELHRRLLTVTAIVGITVAVLGAQPVALMLAGVTDVPSHATLEVIGPWHDASGVLGGFGYAAAITLLAARLGTPGPIATAIAATGQRSMTSYLSQSVVWTVAFTPFLLDLSGSLSVAGTALLASITWLSTVVVADRMRRAGQRGPFEVLVRRVTYGRRVAPALRSVRVDQHPPPIG
ncbi:DUF418 domain-containing protein [Aeromicrobium sp. Root344]|uniref:DUF418 domain-containing protein n=1 Tax=Aeromicrobium sp. Root344 TaxID=1736521 RepID=UPI000A42270D|nr:DUF418 domain-containing protein [Aeromicrobium sp. Root344]